MATWKFGNLVRPFTLMLHGKDTKLVEKLVFECKEMIYKQYDYRKTQLTINVENSNLWICFACHFHKFRNA